MTKKEILKLIDDKYDGDRNKFYEDYPTPESLRDESSGLKIDRDYGGYLNSYNNGGKLPMYQNGTNNAFMTNSYNTGTSTNYNAYMPNGIDYSQPASDNTFGATNYSGTYQPNTSNITTNDPSNTEIAMEAGASAIPMYGQYAQMGNMVSDAVENSANTIDVGGVDTGIGKTAGDRNKKAAEAAIDPTKHLSNTLKYASKDEDGKRHLDKAAFSFFAPGLSNVVLSKMEQKEGLAKAKEEQQGLDIEETDFNKKQALLADRESGELDKANAAANTSGYGTFMAKDGGYANFNPQAEIEDGELIEGTTGTYKAEGDTHENGGIEIGFSENGTPIAGKGGKLTKMYEGGGKMSSAFVSSNNMKVPKDMAERLLKI